MELSCTSLSVATTIYNGLSGVAVTSPIARATKMFAIIDETPGREGWFPALLTKRYWLTRT
jgi:hypothetical protein